MKIAVYPVKDNPYQKFLYAPIKSKLGAENLFYLDEIDTRERLNFIRDVITWPIKLSKIKDKQKIFHIHWQFFYFLINSKIRYYPTVLLTLWSLLWVKLLGFKIVWTVHDYNQHELDPKLDDQIKKILIRLTDRFIVLNSSSYEMLTKDDKIAPERIMLIPIGNYGNDKEYVPKGTDTFFTFIFFGLVRKYKGVDRLISAFKKITGEDIKLLITGDFYDKSYFSALQKTISLDSRITIKDEYTNNKELASLIHQSDVAVLPFLEITNSSSAILAYSKGRPVIAPLIGSFKDHPSNIGFFYDKNTEESLISMMKEAISQRRKLELMGMNALEYAKSLDWKTISSETLDLFESMY